MKTWAKHRNFLRQDIGRVSAGSAGQNSEKFEVKVSPLVKPVIGVGGEEPSGETL